MEEYYLSLDPAKEHDYFGIVVLERIGDTIKLRATKRLQLDYTLARDYILSLHRKYDFRKVFCDQTGIGNVILDVLREVGLPIEGITLSNPAKVEIIETTIRLFQENRLQLPRFGANDLKSEITSQERSLTKAGHISFTHSSKVSSDLFYAFCIGCFMLKKVIDIPEPVTLILKHNSDATDTKQSWESLSSDTLKFREEQA